MMEVAMKTLAAAAFALLSALPAVALEDERRHVDVVFCIDRSGSMQQVIDTAKRKVWSIVNEISRAKPAPHLRIGLIGYGSGDREFKTFPLSDDLDTVYENLMTFKTDMGGDEWVGRAIQEAAEKMPWTTGKKDVRIIFMVGNETAAQGREDVMYTKTAPEAIKKDIVVNAIYCGRPNSEEERTWREVASLADGQYAVIDLSGGAVSIATPFDQKLVELNGKLNDTYLPFGRHGADGKEKQLASDRAAVQSGGAPTAAARSVAKAGGNYRNAGWDLVDAAKEKDFKYEGLKKEELPEEMRSMTPEQQKAHVEKKAAERAELGKQVAQMNAEREKFIQAEMKAKNLTEDKAFDEAVRRSVRSQAEKKGFTFEEQK
jgi:Mg-chelatase subunit ChlD